MATNKWVSGVSRPIWLTSDIASGKNNIRQAKLKIENAPKKCPSLFMVIVDHGYELLCFQLFADSGIYFNAIRRVFLSCLAGFINFNGYLSVK